MASFLAIVIHPQNNLHGHATFPGGLLGGDQVRETLHRGTDHVDRIVATAEVRDRVRRILECGYALTRSRSTARRLASLAYANGDYESCVHLMEEARKGEEGLTDTLIVRLHTQALVRLGRYDDALKVDANYAGRSPKSGSRTYRRSLERTIEILRGTRVIAKDRLSGPVGLLMWKPYTAMDHIMPNRKVHYGRRDQKGSFGYTWSFRGTVPDKHEIHFFTRVQKEYVVGAAFTGIALNAGIDRKHQFLIGIQDWYDAASYNVSTDLSLRRWQKGAGGLGHLPLPGFSNDFTDTIRIYKTPQRTTVRCNGAWITTDFPPHLGEKGERLNGEPVLCYHATKASADIGIFIPTRRPYDNDAIRERMEKIIDPKAKRSSEERLRLWIEAIQLSPPNNPMKVYTNWFSGSLKKKVKIPAWPKDAPKLEPLTAKGAADRFSARGAVLWTKQDPANSDSVWCARPDGTVEVMSLIRFWTTKHAGFRFAVGGDIKIGNPLFGEETIWFPTDSGLFRLDRRDGLVRQVPLGGVSFDLPVSSVTKVRTTLTVKTRTGNWTLNLRTGRWGR